MYENIIKKVTQYELLSLSYVHYRRIIFAALSSPSLRISAKYRTHHRKAC